MGGVMLLQAAAGADAVSWHVPGPCPGEDILRSEVRRLLGGATPDLTDVRIEGHVESLSRGFRLRLVVETPDGSTERRLEAPTCEPLVDSAALYVAMAVDAVATVTKAQEPPPGADPSDPAPTPEPPPQSRAPRLRALDLRAAGGVSVAAYPAPGGLGSLTGSLLLGDVRLELGGTFTGWTPIAVASSEAPAASIVAGGAELRACPAFRRGSVELFGCAGFHLGMARARGVSVDTSSVARRVSADALVGTGLAWWPAQRVGLWLEPSMVLGLYRPRFVVDGVDGSVTRGAVAARVTLGLSIRLWEATHG